jgi:hypothetical protein
MSPKIWFFQWIKCAERAWWHKKKKGFDTDLVVKRKDKIRLGGIRVFFLLERERDLILYRSI